MLGFNPLASAPLADDGVVPGVGVVVSGVSATGGVGSATATGDAAVLVTGVFATGRVTGVVVWSLVDPGTAPDWTDIAPSETPDWTDIAA